MAGKEGEMERAAVNFAFIDARLVTSMVALETAIHHSLLTEEQGALRTKYIHSEILWALNPTNNISEAIRRFGVGDTTTSLVVVFVSKSATLKTPAVQKAMESVVQGKIVPFNESPTDWAAVKKIYQYYKLSADTSLQGLALEEERRQIDKIVTNMIAIKSVVI